MSINRKIDKKDQKVHFSYDISLMLSVLLLVGIGVVMVYSASSAFAMEKYGSEFFFLKKQALFAIIGLCSMIIFTHIPYRLFQPLTYVLLFIAFALLMAIHISDFGYTAGGSARWLKFGKLTMQPSEIARFSFIIYLAYSMSKKEGRLKEFKIGFLPHFIMLLLFMVLILMQPDFGSIVILSAITWILLYVGGVRISHLLSVFILILPVGVLFMINAPYRLRRLMTFWNPWDYPAGEGYQIVHSLMAFGSGGIWGTGIGNGYQKLFYLPEPHTDFIFSVIGEELGLIGVLVIIALYLLVIWKGMIIAKNAPDSFGSLFAAGITISLAIQICINLGVTLGLLPTKGLTLPFLSYGGTSLLLSMTSIGILMNIRMYQQKK